MSKSKITSERPNGAFCLISSYLEKIGVSSSLSDTKEWLFPYDVGFTGGALNRIFRDEFPTGQEIWNPSDSNETYTDLLDRYSRKLFPAVLAKSGYNLRPFYQTLASAMELLRNKSEADLPKASSAFHQRSRTVGRSFPCPGQPAHPPAVFRSAGSRRIQERPLCGYVLYCDRLHRAEIFRTVQWP